MNLDSFLKTAAVALPEGDQRNQRTPSSYVAPETATQPDLGAGGAAPPQGADFAPSESVTDVTQSSSEAGVGGVNVVTDVTPAGIEVLYQSQPKRLYKLRKHHMLCDPEQTWRTEWREVPSVTTVLGVLDKPGLVWHGQKVGIQGVIELFERGVLETAFDWDTDQERLCVNGEYATEPIVTDLLKEHKLTVNHHLDKASDRGVNVHDALESWAATGQLPNAREFPPAEQPYVEGLVKFLEDVQPIPIRQEVMVGSLEHGYAGRFDLVFGTRDTPREFTAKCYPKRADKREEIAPDITVLGDLKTSKGVYGTHFLQLAAYELAAQECGYPPTDRQAVIHVTDTGQYELVFSKATSDQFLAIRRAYEALEELKK